MNSDGEILFRYFVDQWVVCCRASGSVCSCIWRTIWEAGKESSSTCSYVLICREMYNIQHFLMCWDSPFNVLEKHEQLWNERPRLSKMVFFFLIMRKKSFYLFGWLIEIQIVLLLVLKMWHSWLFNLLFTGKSCVHTSGCGGTASLQS